MRRGEQGVAAPAAAGLQLYCARSSTALPPLARLEDARRGQRRGGGWQVARDGTNSSPNPEPSSWP